MGVGFSSGSEAPPEATRRTLLAQGLAYGFCSTEFLSYSWGELADEASRVCQCESSGRPTAISPGTPYYGLFQVDAPLHQIDTAHMLDPIYNSAFAALLQSRDGWRPWPVCGSEETRTLS